MEQEKLKRLSMIATKLTLTTPKTNKNSQQILLLWLLSQIFKEITRGKIMQVILPKEQVEQIQHLLSELIKQEIEKRLNNSILESPYLNKQQTCKYLAISNNTLDSWIQKGLPVIRVGKTVRFNKDDLNNWLQNQ